MSKPKARHPGSYYHIVRRIHRREFRLRPDDDLNGAIACLIQDACEYTGCQVVAICVLSNHIHVVLYDPYGAVSAWMSHIFGTLARYLNTAHKVESHVWNAQEIKDFRLGDLGAVAKAAAYVIANPVAAGLVYNPSAWPGICTTLGEVASGRGPVHKRPDVFFREEGPVSEEAMIFHECPPHVSPSRFRTMVETELEPMLTKARAKVDGRERRYVGASAVMDADPFSKPATLTKKNVGKKNVGKKNVGKQNVGERAKSIWTQVASTRSRAKMMVEQALEFVDKHAAARAELRNPIRDYEVIFPAGTWRHWRYYGSEREPPLTQGFAVP